MKLAILVEHRVLMTKSGSKIWIGLTALTAWFALGLQLYIMVDNTPGNGLTPLQAVGRFFAFFTILTNLLVAISLITVLLKPGSSGGRFFAGPSVATAIALYIFAVGLVYNIVLRSLWNPTGWQRIADELLHVAVPLMYIVYWLAFSPKTTLPWKLAFKWVAFPLLYLVYALVRGSLEGFYAYPFIDVSKLGYGHVLLNALGLSVIFILAGILTITLGNRLVRSGVRRN